MDMKASRLSVAAIGFAILVIAMDFAVIRAAFFGPGPSGSAERGAPLLPHDLADPVYKSGPPGSAVFAFFLLPMIDALLVGVYRLWRRGDHTAWTVGFVVAGSAATLAVFTSCLISPATAIGMVMRISRPIALASFHALARLSGHGELLYRAPLKMTYGVMALEWTYVVIFAILIPIAFFCFLPLLVAVISARVGRQFGPRQPTVEPDSGKTTRDVATPDIAIQPPHLTAGR
jgi:hypothetical protein